VPDLHHRGIDRESMYALLYERYRLRPARADEQVSARLPTAQERRMLKCASGIVLVIERQTFLSNGTPLELSSIVAPAERYRYRVGLAAGR
jgi:GntR family transcriptional regulator